MTNSAFLTANAITFSYKRQNIFEDLSLRIFPGEIVALVGPNGSGKSTLLKALSRHITPTKGSVFLNDRLISQYSRRELARQIASLPQSPEAPPGLTVMELIEQGRYPHIGPLGTLQKKDYEAIEQAVELTGIREFLTRFVSDLSGGERQRVWFALTLVQQAPILLLDEPTTFLDLRYQFEILDLILRLNNDFNKTIVLVLHDLNEAARYAHRMVFLSSGRIVADGKPSQVFNAALIEDVFGIFSEVHMDHDRKVPYYIPKALKSS